MKNIKKLFRSYDPEECLMLYDFDQNIPFEKYNRGVGSSIHNLVYDIGIGYDTLMQYIGKEDANGKKIFEGDILKGNLSYENSDDVYPLVKIIWDNEKSAFIPEHIDGHGSWIPIGWIKGYTVIGNIYQDKALIPSLK